MPDPIRITATASAVRRAIARVAADPERPALTVLIQTPTRWGRADTTVSSDLLTDAKAEVRRVGGRLTDGYMVYAFDGTAQAPYVDNLGSLRWDWTNTPAKGDPIPPSPIIGRWLVPGDHTVLPAR